MNYIKEKIRAFTDKSTLEKTMIIVPYAMVMLLSVRVCELYRLCKSNIFTFIKHLDYIIRAGPHIKLRDLIIGLPLGYMIVWFIRWDRKRHIKKTRPGVEHLVRSPKGRADHLNLVVFFRIRRSKGR